MIQIMAETVVVMVPVMITAITINNNDSVGDDDNITVIVYDSISSLPLVTYNVHT